MFFNFRFNISPLFLQHMFHSPTVERRCIGMHVYNLSLRLHSLMCHLSLANYRHVHKSINVVKFKITLFLSLNTIKICFILSETVLGVQWLFKESLKC